MLDPTLLGEVACLAAALCWAVAVTMFRRPIVEHGPSLVNLAKSLIAAVLFGVTTWFLGYWPVLAQAPRRDVVLIAVSGLVGLSVGDTALFAAVQRLGVHRTLLLQTLGPVFTALLAMGFYGERLTLRQLAGAVVILTGVAVVVAPDRRAARHPLDVSGLGLAVLAALGQAAGIVLAKDGMANVPPLAAAFVRLGAAAVGLVVVLGAAGRLLPSRGMPRTPASFMRLLVPTLLGTYLAVFLMMLGIALAPAPIVATLLATTPVWSLFLEARLEGTRITVRSLVGTAAAILGVAILTLTV